MDPITIASISVVACTIGIAATWIVLSLSRTVTRAANKAIAESISAASQRVRTNPRHIRIVDCITDPPKFITGQTYEHVHFTGPACIKFGDNNSLWFCSVSDRQAILPMAEGAPILGVIFVVGCTFRHCYFDGITIMGTMDEIETFLGPALDARSVEQWEAANVG